MKYLKHLAVWQAVTASLVAFFGSMSLHPIQVGAILGYGLIMAVLSK